MFTYIKVVRDGLSFLFLRSLNTIIQIISGAAAIVSGFSSSGKGIDGNVVKFILAILVIIFIGII